MDDKARRRRGIRASRQDRPEAERQKAGAAIRDALLPQPWVEMAGLVACYWSIGTEPPTRGLVYALWKHGATVILPVLREDFDLDWAAYDGPGTLERTEKGLMEPVDTRRGPDAIRTAALVLVPALAVARDGTRLGKGAGCYDRALARVGPNVPTVALLYDDEIVDELPAEPHDRPVRMAAAPSGLHAFARRHPPTA